MTMAKVKMVAAGVVVAAGIGGCASSAVHVYDTPFPGPGSQYTLAGTTREQVIEHLGSPTTVSKRSDGREELHYRVTGTKRTTYLLMGEKEHATVDDISLLLDNGTVVSGSWRDGEGTTTHW